ncbi:MULTISPECIES: 2'-5' RNA ligase family protein [Rhodanobacter]|uniref:2'-5' RNA ligase family protein n=1 Tax=Rhodanobacter TaxID=75309 RepID=UPI0004899CD4|nr:MULTISPECIES: 2'-5' RNA ligase family protein [Rhodanobacter]KZC20553.1 2'-5' RNA ligase [Rhodanobacter denitrificans]UJM92462.1 2'-5' RNA ligase family protein [Rhodanobacter denitrificans]UJM95992.1 2'-5' RNA ligase family protein [Rhodanobacter denitrificans]UJN21177.1 2'-5' RNA ligase family protein [Rhodanobacter denitrificans]
MTTRTHSPGPLQADLLGGDAGGSVPMHRLFLALLPDAATRARLAQAAAALKAGQPDLRARWVNPARYHATLHFLGDHALLRQAVVDAAMTAARGLRMAPFAWVLHEAASFQGRQPPCILRSASVPEPLQRLWHDLRRALVLAGQGRHVARHFTPHVTIAYSQGARLASTPITPVTWPVERFALVHGVVGQPDYQVLAEWPLQDDSAGVQA